MRSFLCETLEQDIYYLLFHSLLDKTRVKTEKVVPQDQMLT